MKNTKLKRFFVNMDGSSRPFENCNYGIKTSMDMKSFDIKSAIECNGINNPQ